MIIYKQSTHLQEGMFPVIEKGMAIGFVPTMGALHAGHIELILKSREVCTTTVSSIFINPRQFNNKEDFTKYPVSLEKDILMLEQNHCDITFIPNVEEIYPPETTPHVFDLGYLETILEGRYRPGHFQGVCQVVERLLKLVTPTHLFIGQKDYQQCLVISRLIKSLSLPVEIVICPTVREEDGLAMSSRNLRLNTEQRKRAPYIYQCLQDIKEKIQPGNLEKLKSENTRRLADKGFSVDYVEIARANDLTSISEWDGNEPLVALIAAYINDIRLIDNILLTR